MKKITSRLIISALIVNLTACGTIFHSERMGQRHSGEMDIKIAVADGIGLLFFIVPGIIAFAVDFHYGTIYLPSRYGKNDTDKSFRLVKADKEITHDYLEALLTKELGLHVDLDADSTLTSENGSLNDIRLFNSKVRELASYSE
ncbi:hypothetical protein MMIC_P2301 [Mariprofundus micogutta]|uniref:Uncharacterized protein n=1 Tax=Mariprofundus micogutta TaxID=1921010 RepID=A0A1L8CQX7_9PROT|nr:hypothetical protein [Mariprofundus micogutta]GAV21318.1 hypothetical protein MMIC_P2301 [Mariprofundus micogutta]